MAQAQIAHPGGASPGRAGARRIGSAGSSDQIFESVVTGIGGLVIVTLVGLIALLVVDSWPAIQRYGFNFITDSTWDPVKDINYIINVTGYAFGIAVPADSPFKSWNDFVAYAKANPGKVRYASVGIGSNNH